MSEYLNRYDLMQRLGNKVPRESKGWSGTVNALCWVSVGFIMGAFLLPPIDPRPKVSQQSCKECHNSKTQLTQYFKDSGNKHPEKMATAVLATNKPKLLAAVAVAGEKNTPYTVRKGGYKKRHAGAWQVNPKYWGPVPKDPIGQALQAERILEDLTGDSKNIRTALSIYGGDSSSRYANRVLKELQEVPM